MLGDTDYFKEKHFFDQADRCSKGFDWYSNRYFHKKGCNYLDATPYIGQPSGEDQLPFALTTAARVFYSVPPAFKAQVRLVALATSAGPVPTLSEGAFGLALSVMTQPKQNPTIMKLDCAEDSLPFIA